MMYDDAPLMPAFPELSPDRKPRLLLVDDQPIIIKAIHSVFARECRLFMATSGAQALEMCKDKLPDLILLDVEMPEMDGMEVCRRVKADETFRHIPIIFVTAHTSAEQETRGLACGAVDFISKPINPSVLRARVRTHLLLKFQSDVLRGLVFFDGLTGVYNRRYFDQQLERESARAARHNNPLSLIMLDVDHFKAYNDHYGHLAGDDCLRTIAQLLKSTLKRSTDMVARYGGEEFACLLPDTDLDQAMRLAEEMQTLIQSKAMPHVKAEPRAVVTVSLGVTSGSGPLVKAPLLLAAADQQLYRAKKAGRAQACGAPLGPDAAQA